MKCENEKIDGANPCTATADYLFTWPGKERSKLCAYHMAKLSKVTLPSQLDIASIGSAPPFVPPSETDAVNPVIREAERTNPRNESTTYTHGERDEFDSTSRPVRR